MTPAVVDLISAENPIFRTYIFYCSILVIKMMFMTLLTGFQRFRTMTFANPEDAKNFNIDTKMDENVERVRRAHHNDLENIPLFFVTALLYIMTDPAQYVAKSLFLVYTLTRITHTLVYAVIVVPQPARFLSFALGVTITAYMAVATLVYFARDIF